jgi:hypothetical protein
MADTTRIQTVRTQLQQVGQTAQTQVQNGLTQLQAQMTNAAGFVPDEVVFRNATGADGSMVAKGSGQLSKLSNQLGNFIATGGDTPGIQHKLASAGKTVLDRGHRYFQSVGEFARTADTQGVSTAIGNVIDGSPAFIRVPVKAVQGFGKAAFRFVTAPLGGVDDALKNVPSKARDAVTNAFSTPMNAATNAAETAATAATAGTDDALKAAATAGATKTVRNLAVGNVAIQALFFIPRVIGDTVRGFATGGLGGAVEGATDSTAVQGAGIAGGLVAAKGLSKLAPIVGKIPGPLGKVAQVALTLIGAAAGSALGEGAAKAVVGTPGEK